MMYAELDASGAVTAIISEDGFGRVKIRDGDGCAVGRVFNGWTFDARQWTSFQFLLRLTFEERTALLASTDPTIRDLLVLVSAAQTVVADDPRLLAGMAYAVDAGFFSPTRADKILNPAL